MFTFKRHVRSSRRTVHTRKHCGFRENNKGEQFEPKETNRLSVIPRAPRFGQFFMGCIERDTPFFETDAFGGKAGLMAT